MSRACRSLRRPEDPALVEGFGRFTADLPADLAVRFVRGAIDAPTAIVNAISDALASFGVALYEIPAGPQRIRALLCAAMEKRT